MSSYIELASQTISSPIVSISFSSIPTTSAGKTLRDLVIIGSNLNTVSSGSSPRIRFNNSAAANSYNSVFMGTVLGSVTSNQPSSTGISPFDSGLSSNTNAMLIMQIMDFAQTNKHKSILIRTDSAGAELYAHGSRWVDNSAINNISLEVPNHQWAVGTMFTLYGIEG